MLSAIATDSDNMVKPVSENKFLCVKCGLRTKSCKQNRTARTSSFLMATRSRPMVNSSRCVGDPRITSDVNWNTWNREFQKRWDNTKGLKPQAWLATIHTLYRCRRARKPACAEQNDRTSPTSGRLLVDDRSSCRCSCTKDWYSARHASTSLPLV